jgi:hypothetical protein
MAFVSTLGANNANSYLSVARAISLAGDLPASDGLNAWNSLTTASKEKTLVIATLIINSLRWKGKPATQEQSLAWPRQIIADNRLLSTEELPLDFEFAVVYMAAFLGQNGGYTAVVEGDGGSALQETNQYQEVELGDGALRVKFRTDDTAQSGFEYIPPFSMDILKKYIIDESFHQPHFTKASNARLNRNRGFGAYRPNGVRVVNGQLFPVYGGWASNPL